MDKQLLLICALTFIIHIIGTLAYSVRARGGLERHGDHQLAVDIGAVAADLIAAVFG